MTFVLILGILMMVWALSMLIKAPVKYNPIERIKERKEPVVFTQEFSEWFEEIRRLRNTPMQ